MVLLLNSEPSQEPNQPEDSQTPPATNAPPQAKSIDGVKPAPKLSGENQEHHLGEASAPQQPAEGADQQAQETDQEIGQSEQENPPSKSKPAGNDFPFIAVSFAVITAAGLIGLAIYLQLNAS